MPTVTYCHIDDSINIQDALQPGEILLLINSNNVAVILPQCTSSAQDAYQTIQQLLKARSLYKEAKIHTVKVLKCNIANNDDVMCTRSQYMDSYKLLPTQEQISATVRQVMQQLNGMENCQRITNARHYAVINPSAILTFTSNIRPISGTLAHHFRHPPALPVSPTHNPCRIPIIMLDALTIILSNGALALLCILSLGPFAALGLSIVGSMISCFACTSLFSNFGTLYQQCKVHHDDENLFRSSWRLQDNIMFIISTLVKSVCVILTLITAFSAFGIISCSILGMMLMLVTTIVIMVTATGIDHQIKLMDYSLFS
jgi:hypothetical protein